MISYDEFVYYKKFTIGVFNFCNGKVNPLNPYIILEIDYADDVRHTYANIIKPNMLLVHIDNIVSQYYGDEDKIRSLIFIAITHELLHSEQCMSQMKYRMDRNYMGFIESCVDTACYKWLYLNRREIEHLFHFNLSFDYFRDKVIDMEDYERNGLEEYYKQILMDMVFRDDETYYRFERAILDQYDNVVINFNNSPNLLIKSKGKFCENTLKEFVQAVGAAASVYDNYTLEVNVVEAPYRGMQKAMMVTFMLTNRIIKPMHFIN